MHPYAQTNVQLFNQLRSEGYSKEERAFISNTYQFGMRIFTGLYLPSGKPFLDHLVGTASILARLRAPIAVVAAGLVHATYLHGDFGCRTGISDEKRKRVIDVVGKESEDYITRYDRFLLTAEDVASLESTRQQLSKVDRYIVLMRLANELEHNLDFSGLYFVQGKEQQGSHRRYLERRLPALLKLANALGYGSLAAEFENIQREIAVLKLPLESVIVSREKVAYLIAPRSYRVRFVIGVPKLMLKDLPQRGKLLSLKAYRVLGHLIAQLSRPRSRV
jgi:(p)ppGpp synthase/HD superfamily hydrolase